MPTVGWIYEGDLSRVLAARPWPQTGPVRFTCPICGREFDTAAARERHLGDDHPVEQPALWLGGRRAAATERVRSPLLPGEILVTGCTQVTGFRDGRPEPGLSAGALPARLAEMRRAYVELRLVNHRAADALTARATHFVDIDVPDPSAMDHVDALFVERLARDGITLANIDTFRRNTEPIDAPAYVGALCEYAIAVLVKEQDPESGVSLPFARYLERLQRAFDGLRDVRRPLADSSARRSGST